MAHVAMVNLSADEMVHPRDGAYHLYLVRHPMRNRLRIALEETGIETGLYYPVESHLQRAFQSLGLRPGDFAQTGGWATQGPSLPMYLELTEEAVVRVSSAVADTVSSPHVSARRSA